MHRVGERRLRRARRDRDDALQRHVQRGGGHPAVLVARRLHADPESDSAGKQDAEWQVFQGVSGNFYGTTDMILRWAACKWGIDEDVVRAEAVEESSWIQSEAAGCGSTMCTVLGSAAPASSAGNYWDGAGDGGTCCPTKGILQVGLPYWYANPYAVSSTALNADYRMAAERSCMNGDITWLVGTNGGAGTGSLDSVPTRQRSRPPRSTAAWATGTPEAGTTPAGAST